jgi:hypothetical protein
MVSGSFSKAEMPKVAHLNKMSAYIEPIKISDYTSLNFQQYKIGITKIIII